MTLRDTGRRYLFAFAVQTKLRRMITRFSDRDRGVSEWLYTDYGDVYLRVTYHSVRSGRWSICLDLASIEIRPQYRRIGLFKVALKVFENTARAYNIEYVRVENVLNEDLKKYLISQGYVHCFGDELSVYKRNARHV